MGTKCSGSNCPMQYGINVETCDITETCSYFTPQITLCDFCKTFPATQEIQGKPCCGFCKMSLDLAKQFSDLQSEISSGFKRIEKSIVALGQEKSWNMEIVMNGESE